MRSSANFLADRITPPSRFNPLCSTFLFSRCLTRAISIAGGTDVYVRGSLGGRSRHLCRQLRPSAGGDPVERGRRRGPPAGRPQGPSRDTRYRGRGFAQWSRGLPRVNPHHAPGTPITVYYSVAVWSEGDNGIAIPGWEPWENACATLYHELNEARTDPAQPALRGRLKSSPQDYLTERIIAPSSPLAARFGRPGQVLLWPGQILIGHPRQNGQDIATPLAPLPVAAEWVINSRSWCCGSCNRMCRHSGRRCAPTRGKWSDETMT